MKDVRNPVEALAFPPKAQTLNGNARRNRVGSLALILL